jgi:hypothetical protein
LQTSQINNPGLAAAPAVTSLSLTPETDTITGDSGSPLGLTATTTNAPSTVALYRDGTIRRDSSAGTWAVVHPRSSVIALMRPPRRL